MAKSITFGSVKAEEGVITSASIIKEAITNFDAWTPTDIAIDFRTSKASELGLVLGDNLIDGSITADKTIVMANGNKIVIRRPNSSRCRVDFQLADGTYAGGTLTGYGYEEVYLLVGTITDNDDVEHVFVGNIQKTSAGDREDITYSGLMSVQRADLWLNGIYVPPKNDPYAGGGTSGSGGGGGNFDASSDPIDIPSLPSLSASNTGFLTLYSPTLAQIQDLAHFMWSDDFIDVLVKLWNDPMQIILGLSIVPAIPQLGTSQNIKAGNVDSGVPAHILPTQYVEFDCGTLSVPEFFGAYLDYSPYTSLSIYLPYIGAHELDTDEVMNATLRVVYHIDVLSGACVCFIKSEQSILYTFQGNCGVQIPVTSENMSRFYQAVLGSATSLIGSVGTGGMTAGGITNAFTTLSSTASAVANAKPNVSHSGSVGSSAGLMGVQYPYLILKRPRQCLPEEQSEIKGYGSYITANFSELSGYTEIDSVNLTDIPCTDAERNEIMELLKKGVIF